MDTMNLLLTTLFFLAALAIPNAPTTLELHGAIVQKLPRCALGTGFDANKDGVIDTGCPGSDDFTTQGTGFAVQLETCDMAGTVESFTDAAADGGTSVRNPSGSGYISGQVRCLATLTAGTYTIKVRARAPNNGRGGFWINTSPHLILPAPTSTVYTNLFNGVQQLTYQWFTLTQTVTVGSTQQVPLFALLDDSMEVDCIYLDTSAVAVPSCPTGTVPPVASFIIKSIAALGESVDAISNTWNPNADVLAFSGAPTGTYNNTAVVKFGWLNTATDRLCMFATVADTDLRATAAADDDGSIFGDDSIEVVYRKDVTPSAGASGDTFKLVFNIGATQRHLDRSPYNAPDDSYTATITKARVNTGTLDDVANDTSYNLEACWNLGFTAVDNQLILLNVRVNDRDATAGYRNAGGDINDINNWIVAQLSSTAITGGGGDTTPPSTGTPVVSNIGSNAFTVTIPCTDAGTGCISITANYDVDSGVPYSFNQSCTVSGTNPNYSGQCNISGLSAGTQYFVRGTSVDGAGNSHSGVEVNTTTTGGLPVNAVYVATTGNDTTGTGTSANPWRTIQRSTRSDRLTPGMTLIVKDGAYNEHVSINCAPGAGATTASANNPIVIRSENERMALIQANGLSALRIENCANWQVVGMRIEGTRNSCIGGSGQCDTVFMRGNTNITLRRNIFRWVQTDALQSVHLIYQQESNGTVYEENEAYGHSHHSFNNQFASSGTIIRRSYANAGPQNGVGCFNMYPGANTWIENNICENAFFGENNANGNPDSILNRYNGNIGINSGVKTDSRASSLQFMPRDTLYKDFVFIGAGVTSESAKNTRCDHCSFFNSSSALNVKREGSVPPSIGDGQSSFFSTNSLFYNSNGSISDPNLTNWGIDSAHMVNSSINTSGAGGTGSITNTNSTDHALLGRCYIYVENGTPGKNTASDGGDRGATVLYRTVNGVTDTSKPLWDWTQVGTQRGRALRASDSPNGWAGAVIAGVNDGTDPNFPLTLSTVHLRLNLGNDTCPTPP